MIGCPFWVSPLKLEAPRSVENFPSWFVNELLEGPEQRDPYSRVLALTSDDIDTPGAKEPAVEELQLVSRGNILIGFEGYVSNTTGTKALSLGGTEV